MKKAVGFRNIAIHNYEATSCYTPAEFERRRAEPGSFVNRVLAQDIIPLIGPSHESARSG